MKYIKNVISFCLFATVIIGVACTPKKQETNQRNLSIVLHNQFADQDLQLQTIYTSLLNENLKFTRLQYYVSNICLKGANGTTWAQPESYHFIQIDEKKGNTHQILLQNIPEGAFHTLEFSVGIDPVRNSSGSQTGALDPLNGMFWIWSTGYIFMRTEGFYISPNQTEKAFVYHIGTNAAYRTVQIPLNQAVFSQAQPTVALKADFQKFFGGFADASIDLKMPIQENSVSIMAGELLPKVADNYSKIFSLK